MKRLVSAAVLGVAMGATAADYTLNDLTLEKTVNWWQSENWLSGGEVPEFAPTNDANAEVILPKVESEGVAVTQTLLWDLKSETSDNPSTQQSYQFKSVFDGDVETGTPDKLTKRVIRFQTRDYSSCWSVCALLKVSHPEDFYGYWKADAGSMTFDLSGGATADHVPVLHNVSANGRNRVVVNANKAKIGTVFTGGAIRKEGAGELEIGATQGTNVAIHVNAGTLTIDGREADIAKDEVPVKGAWLWLDANNADTITFGEGPDTARQYVEKWADVRGEGHPYAYFDRAWKTSGQSYLVPEGASNPPYVNTTILPGKTVLDFGRVYTDTDKGHGPSNCWMRISERSSKVREAFFVCRKTRKADATSVIGDVEQYPFHPSGQAIAGPYAEGNFVRRGETMMNGERMGAASNVFFDDRFSVVSASATASVHVCTIATDRMYTESGRTGGWKIGEIILFERELTHLERFRIQKYLQHKWLEPNSVNDEQPFAEVVTVHSTSGANVKVPEGKTAYVPEMTTVSGTLVKTGAGRLKIGELSASKSADGVAVIDVQGGSVALGGLEPVDDSQPAANPMAWFIPEETYMSFSNETDAAGNKYVTEWRDCRGDATYTAVLPDGDAEADYNGSVFPTLVPNEVGSRATVDFGEWGDNTKGTYLKLRNATTGANLSSYKVYEVYQVIATKSTSTIFASTDGGVGPAGGSNPVNGQLVSNEPGYNLSTGRSAVWMVDGAVVDPTASQFSYAKNDYMVASFSSTYAWQITRIGNKQRTVKAATYNWGGVRIGEVLYYDRQLTAEERRQTQAYLLKRWKGRASQAAERRIASVKFADGVPAVLETDGDCQVGVIDTKANAVVKRGEGVLDLAGGFGIPSGASLDVQAGTLNVKMGISQKPAYNLDAQKPSSLTTEEWTPEPYDGQPEADKAMRTNVLVWADAAESGMTARYDLVRATTTGDFKLADGLPRYKRAPVLQQYEVRPGVWKPVVYFGGINGNYTGIDTGDTYGKIPNANADGSAMFFDKEISGLAELYVIFGDTTVPNKHRAQMFSVRGDGSSNFKRGDSSAGKSPVGTILSTDAAQAVRQGYVAMNGEEIKNFAATNTQVAAGVNLYGFVPTATVTASALTSHGGHIGGGCRIGEQVCFRNALTAAERANFTKQLMKKWFDEDYTISYAAINVEKGAVLNFSVAGENMPSSYEVGSITGGGTITGLPAITGVSALSTACAANGADWSRTTTDGAVTFADAVTVTVDPSAAKRLQNGTYTIFKAALLDNVDLENWTLVCADPLVADRLSLRATENEIKLVVRPKGFSIIVK